MTAFLLSLNWESFPIPWTMNPIFATLPRACINQSLQCGPQTFSVVNQHHVLKSKFSTPDLLSQKFSRRVPILCSGLGTQWAWEPLLWITLNTCLSCLTEKADALSALWTDLIITDANLSFPHWSFFLDYSNFEGR